MNKILILCEENDPSVLEVIEWLTFYNQELIILTEYTYIKDMTILIENNDLDIEFYICSKINAEHFFLNYLKLNHIFIEEVNLFLKNSLKII
jgi:hypothetical protein